ncbi:uroporphyrinogen-III C-methyltransferase [Candidatus Poribacteria bacterium]|nr:MAG: uroporphyrinogen-III C-methyltransferase [Candidatus Poribacteria bacterium]
MNASPDKPDTGIVYIVGAGPGDRKLITLKGVECLQRADVVIYDLLLNDALLEHCPAHTEKIRAPDPRIRATRQTELNQMLVEHAKAGKVVVRLKGGDPYIFGRGGEEAVALTEAGVPFEVVPGITSAIAASAYAGIPVTHRDYASSVAFVTGHSAALRPDSNINWEHLATAVDTLVIYMGVAHLQQITERLITHGRDPQTLVSLVRVGTTPQQQVVQGTLDDIVQKVEAAQLESPAVIIVGEVNRLREQLRWFDTKPLFGKRILVTRARAQASGFAELLEANGAEVIQFPTIEVQPIENVDIPSPKGYDWVIFTSVNAVEIFYERLRGNGNDARAFGTSKICAVGPKTVEALNHIGIHPDFVPSHSRGSAIAAEIADVQGKKVLLPRAKIATADLPTGLREKGAIVGDVPLYDTIKVVSDGDNRRDEIEADLLNGGIDLVTFTSSSTVTNFLELFPAYPPAVLLADVKVAVIGPTTQKTAVKYGVQVDVIAKEASIESLVEAVIQKSGKHKAQALFDRR